MKAKELTRPIPDRKRLREKSYGPEYSPAFRTRNVARGPVNCHFFESSVIIMEFLAKFVSFSDFYALLCK